MQVDWFTVVAQIVNFLVLVGLLKHFLYGPIVKAMDQREKRIADRLREAEDREKEAEEEAQSHRQAREELEQKRGETLEQAKQETEQKRRELIDSARKEVDEMQFRWRESLRQQHDSFLGEMRDQAARQVCAITRRVLRDLADERLESRIVGVFLDRLREMDDDAREQIGDVAGSSSDSLTVVSSFQLPDEARGKVTEALKECFSGSLHPSFTTSDKLICGIELHAGGRKIAWSVNEYLDALSDSLSQALAEESGGNGE
ncbi:MAG: F0F1 ATP synthase subunit B [Armatimonadetes bacterium]|nr:F0F1 ATP synthase subunit B [Gemmatimonadales bacterium]NIO75919.1 F0F1 ATP synthase subunit B [Armatimonadota bacterium]